MRKVKNFSLDERERLKKIICEKTGYYILSNCLLLQAFTRRSYSAEQGGENNEILEFIGDQVLSYYVVKIMAGYCGAFNRECEYTCRAQEGDLSALKQELVSNEMLAKIIDEWDLAEYLIVGKSDFSNQIDRQEKVKADLFEAILGAIAVASQWDSAVLEKAVRQALSMDEKVKCIIEKNYHYMQFDLENAVNTLKELAEHGGCSVPRYEYGTPESLGYDKEGNPRWVCTCYVIDDKTGIIRQVWASSKKAAKKAAAYLVLCEHFEVQNKYGANGRFSSWRYKNGRLMPDHLMKE